MTIATLRMPTFFDLDKVETIADDEANITLDYTAPMGEVEQKTQTTPIITQKSPRYFLMLLGLVGSLLLLTSLVNAYHFIVQHYASSFILGTVFLALIVAICTVALTLSIRTYQNIQALRTVSVLQKEGQQLIDKDGYGGAMPYLNKITQFYSHHPDIKTRLDRFYITLSDTHHDREMCVLFSSEVMQNIDQQAYKIVTKHSQETALMVMISQIALLDAVLTLWRNISMIRTVATLYGGKPGFFGTMSLIGGVLQNLIYAGATEAVADSVTEIMGGSLLSMMSAQVAQGLGSGVLTARIGLYAMQSCRPLPFLAEEKPRLKEIRKEIVKSMKGVFESKH